MSLNRKEEIFSDNIDGLYSERKNESILDEELISMLDTIDMIKSFKEPEMPSSYYVENFVSKIKEIEEQNSNTTMSHQKKKIISWSVMTVTALVASILLAFSLIFHHGGFSPKVSAMQISVIAEKELKNMGKTEVDHPSFISDDRLISYSKEEKIWIWDQQNQIANSLPLGSLQYMRAPAWSKDGKKVIFVGYEKGMAAIWSMNSDGSNLSQLTFPKTMDESHENPTWSPDGNSFAYTKTSIKWNETHGYKILKQEIWIKNLGGEERKLADGKEPAWSGNGKTVSFTKSVTEGTNDKQEIWTINSDGTDLKKLTDGMESSWSPNSQFIAFTKNTTKEKLITAEESNAKYSIVSTLREIWVIHVPSGKLFKLTSAQINEKEVKKMIEGLKKQHQDLPTKLVTSGLYDDWQPVWSKGGKSILFVRNMNSEKGKHFSLYQLSLKFK